MFVPVFFDEPMETCKAVYEFTLGPAEVRGQLLMTTFVDMCTPPGSYETEIFRLIKIWRWSKGLTLSSASYSFSLGNYLQRAPLQADTTLCNPEIQECEGL